MYLCSLCNKWLLLLYDLYIHLLSIIFFEWDSLFVSSKILIAMLSETAIAMGEKVVGCKTIEVNSGHCNGCECDLINATKLTYTDNLSTKLFVARPGNLCKHRPNNSIDKQPYRLAFVQRNTYMDGRVPSLKG